MNFSLYNSISFDCSSWFLFAVSWLNSLWGCETFFVLIAFRSSHYWHLWIMVAEKYFCNICWHQCWRFRWHWHDDPHAVAVHGNNVSRWFLQWHQSCAGWGHHHDQWVVISCQVQPVVLKLPHRHTLAIQQTILLSHVHGPHHQLKKLCLHMNSFFFFH